MKYHWCQGCHIKHSTMPCCDNAFKQTLHLCKDCYETYMKTLSKYNF